MIVKANIADAAHVAALAVILWPDHTLTELVGEFTNHLSDVDNAVFLYVDNGQDVGFAQASLRRDYVEGTDSSPVGYLEGIFVEEPYRKQGVAKQLLKACEDWAKGKGCIEFASDCELTNTQSHAFHLNTGFVEANRIICFTKKL